MKRVHVRDARRADRDSVLDFCRQTWGEYGDYIPRVWRRWIRDRNGRFIVAELDGVPVGIAKITDFGHGEGWLEGLRVDPKYRHLGIANVMNREVLRTLARIRPRSARFCTALTNWASRHIGKKFGFRLACSFRYYWQRSRSGRPKGEIAQRRDINEIYDYISQSRFLALSAGLIGEGWVFREFTRDLLRGYIKRGWVRVLRGRRGIRGVAIYPYEENDESITLGFVDGDSGAVQALAKTCLYMAKARGMKYCSAGVPTRGFVKILEAASFHRKESIGQVVYELSGSGLRKALARRRA